MKALALALLLLLAPPPKAVSPAPPQPAAQPDDAAAAAKATPAKPAKPLVPAKATADPLAECRATCGKSYYFCLQAEDADTCAPTWNQCRAACLRANPQ